MQQLHSSGDASKKKRKAYREDTGSTSAGASASESSKEPAKPNEEIQKK